MRKKLGPAPVAGGARRDGLGLARPSCPRERHVPATRRSQRQRLTSAIEACQAFDRRDEGWLTVKLEPAGAARVRHGPAAEPLFHGNPLSEACPAAGNRRRPPVVQWSAVQRDDTTMSSLDDIRTRPAPHPARPQHLAEVAEGRFEALVEHAPDAIVVLDLEAGRYVTANAAAERLLGMSRAELFTVGPLDVSPPVQPDGTASAVAIEEPLRRALEGETPRFEWVHRSVSGESVPCEVSLLRLPDPIHTLVCWTVVDIRERRRAAELARRLEAERDAALEQVSSILASAGDGIYGIDLEDRVLFANPAAARMLGRSVEEMVGGFAHVRWHHTRASGEPYPESECPTCAAARQGRLRSVAGEVFWRADGTSFPVEYTSAPLLRGDQIVGAVCVFRDATERLAAEEVRRAATAQEAARLAAERLQAATAALSAALTVDEVARVGVAQAAALLQVEWVELCELEDGRLGRALAQIGAPPARADWAAAAAREAVRLGEAVVSPVPASRGRRAQRKNGDGDGAVMSVPLTLAGTVVGALTVAGPREAIGEIGPSVLGALAEQCAQALERARLYEAERRNADRMAFLAEASELFSGVLDDDGVFDQLARLAVPRIADSCVIHEVAGSGAVSAAAAGPATRSSPGPDDPLGVDAVLRTGHSTLVREMAPDVLAAAGVRSAMIVPVRSDSRLMGAITLLVGESERRYDTEDLAFAEDLARRVALALDNARLRDEERRERERAAFMAEASAALDAPLALEERVEQLVRIVVPRLADLCIVHLLDIDRLRVSALAHADPELEGVAWRVSRREPGREREQALGEVLQTARGRLVADVSEAMLDQDAADDEYGQDLRRIGPRSLMMVPLIARGAPIGVMSVIRCGERAAYDERDLDRAEELGRRAGVAIDNARLFERERGARALAESAYADAHAARAQSEAARAQAETARTQAEAARERILRLHGLSAALSRALGREDVAEVIAREGMAAAGARRAMIGVREEAECVVLAQASDEIRAARSPTRLPLDGAEPLVRAITGGQPLWSVAEDPAAGTESGGGAALPLVVAGRTIGAIWFEFEASHDHDRANNAFLLALAGQCAQALERAERYEAEHRVAVTLQRSLLPPDPPEIPGIDAAVRYMPAGEGLEAGGDWYDVIALPGRRVAVAVGDVVGRGVEAAAAMGQLESALRAFALQGEGPGSMIEQLAGFAASVPNATMATVACALLDLSDGALRYSCAGHPPPLVVRADGTDEYLWGGRGAPLAPELGHSYAEANAQMGIGDTLILYSDGLVERRGESIDEGLDRLARAAASASGSAEQVCRHILGSLLASPAPADDVALLVLRRSSHAPFERRLRADPQALQEVRREVRRWLQVAGADEEALLDFLVACGEALSNAVEHAYPAGHEDAWVEVRLACEPDGVIEATVRDFGRWRRRRPPAGRGRGLELMERLADEVRVERDPGGTVVVLRLRLVT